MEIPFKRPSQTGKSHGLHEELVERNRTAVSSHPSLKLSPSKVTIMAIRRPLVPEINVSLLYVVFTL